MRVIMLLLGVLMALASAQQQDQRNVKQKRNGAGGPKMVPVPVPIPVPVHHHHHHPVVMPSGSSNYQEWAGSSSQLFPEAQMLQETQDNGFFDSRGLRDFDVPMNYPRYAYQPGLEGPSRPRKAYYSGSSSGPVERPSEHYGPNGSGSVHHRRRQRPVRPEMDSHGPASLKTPENYEANDW